MIDSHCHINDNKLDNLRNDIIANLNTDGLSAICEVGYDIASSMQALDLAHSHDNIFAIVGNHPQSVDDFDKCRDLEILKNLSCDPKVIGIGEIGLDYYWVSDNKQKQKDMFADVLQLSCEVGLPAVLHIRDAYGDALDILKAHKSILNYGILLHCYSGSAEMVKSFDEFDCYYALGGAVTFKNSKKQDVIKSIALDRLLLETDCPYMTPMPYRGQLNQPKYLKYIASHIADVLQLSTSQIIGKTTQNTQTLFKKLKYRSIYEQK